METPKKMMFEDSVSSNHKDNKLSYDDAFKRSFSRKTVLAALLKEIVPDYHDLSISEIEELIISSRINQLNAETLAEEDVIFGSKIMYDVVIQCTVPNTYTLPVYSTWICLCGNLEFAYYTRTSDYDSMITCCNCGRSTSINNVKLAFFMHSKERFLILMSVMIGLMMIKRYMIQFRKMRGTHMV